MNATTAIRSQTAVPFGHSREFVIGGRTVTVTRTESGLYLISQDDRLAVVHPQPNGRYIVTGPGERDVRSEPVDYETAIDICLARLR
ncbi:MULTISPECIES: hypothetical protein [Gryllotalpicola]|uniref:Uncharacterized protein n=1 Tax=Gryllotalpicola kribbensis TaxID=993084 RepID=A0ABP8AWZ6_9MICO|nr:hypothetical protein [Gryllotalpicola protaetiae]